MRVRTTWNGAGGIGGFFERTFAPKGLRRIYGEILDRLDRELARLSRAARSPIRRDHGPVTAAPAHRAATAAVDALADLRGRRRRRRPVRRGAVHRLRHPRLPRATGSLRRHTPMTYQTFTRDPRGRHRYWARSYVGWRRIRGARPNDGHRAVGELQRAGLLGAVITQNVDGLHQAGGARDVVELHGGLDRTVCLDCGDVAGAGRSSTSGCGRPTRRSARGSTR